MTVRSLGALGVCLGIGGAVAAAADTAIDVMPLFSTVQVPPTPPRPPAPQPPATRPPTPPVMPTPMPDITAAPVTDVFARAPQAGTTAASNFQPHMLGDLLAGSYAQASFPLIIQVPVTIPGTPGNPRLKIPPVPPQTVLVNQLIFPAIVSQPIVTRGAF